MSAASNYLTYARTVSELRAFAFRSHLITVRTNSRIIQHSIALSFVNFHVIDKWEHFMLISLNISWSFYAKSLNAHTFVFCANLCGVMNNGGRKVIFGNKTIQNFVFYQITIANILNKGKSDCLLSFPWQRQLLTINWRFSL